MALHDYGEDGNEPASGTETKRDCQMSARRRREKFKIQLRECNEISAVMNKSKRNVYNTRTKSGDALVWTHYSKAFNFWGGAVQKNDELRAREPRLIHAFLGGCPDEYYIVPDEELHSGDFYTPRQNKNGNQHWRLAKEGNDGRNSEILNSKYTTLCGSFR
jgi:hypothetical protein